MEMLTLAFSFASRMICEDICVGSEVQTDAVSCLSMKYPTKGRPLRPHVGSRHICLGWWRCWKLEA